MSTAHGAGRGAGGVPPGKHSPNTTQEAGR